MELRETVCPSLLEARRHFAFASYATWTPVAVRQVREVVFVNLFLRRELRIQNFPRIPYPKLPLRGNFYPFTSRWRHFIRIYRSYSFNWVTRFCKDPVTAYFACPIKGG